MAPKRVLIVDDALEMGRMLKAAIHTWNKTLDINVVPSAEEALLEITAEPLNLLIADIRLPGMSGLDLVSRVHSRSSQTRIMVITGLAGENLPAQAQAAGADRFMRKPLHMAEFMDAVGELLGLEPPAEVKPAAVKAPAPVEAPAQPDMAGVLLHLRNTLGAQLVLMADDTGKVLVQVGERPSFDFEKQWAPAVLAALSAAQKAGRLINPGMPQGAMVLRGSSEQLVLAPVGNYALLILLSLDASGLRTALALEETLNAQSLLEGILDRIGAAFRPIAVAQTPEQLEKMMAPPAPEAEKPAGSGTAELKELQTKLNETEKELDTKEADDFWEMGLTETPSSPEQADVLTYDEARQLGLTPDTD